MTSPIIPAADLVAAMEQYCEAANRAPIPAALTALADLPRLLRYVRHLEAAIRAEIAECESEYHCGWTTDCPRCRRLRAAIAEVPT